MWLVIAAATGPRLAGLAGNEISYCTVAGSGSVAVILAVRSIRRRGAV